ncbi:DUF945 family protein [Pseudidiomarina insulisalsae]|nr:DUF945 family protein [Pseudidiomarina insulisalsae]
MKFKGLIIGAVVAAAALVVAPWWIGQQVETKVTRYVQLFSEGQPTYHAELLSYERSWFGANATISLSMDPALFAAVDDMESDFSMTMELSIQHGPVLTDQGLELGLNSWQLLATGNDLREQLSWDSERPLYLQQGRVNLLGDAVFIDYIPELQWQSLESEAFLTLSAYRGAGTYQNEVLEYAGDFDRFMAVIEENEIVMDQMALVLNAHASMETLLQGQLYENTARFTVAAIEVSDPDELLFALNGLQVTSELMFRDDLMDGVVNYELAEMFAAGERISDMQLKVALRNLDRQVIQRYIEQFNKLYQQDPEIVEEEFELLLEQEALALLQAEPEFVIERFNAVFPAGRVHGDALVGIYGVTSLPATTDDPDFWFAHLRGDMFTEIDKSLMDWVLERYVEYSLLAMQPGYSEQAEEQQQTAIAQVKAQMLQGLLQSGFLREVEQTYQSSVSFANGELTVNGQVMPLEQWLGAM